MPRLGISGARRVQAGREKVRLHWASEMTVPLLPSTCSPVSTLSAAHRRKRFICAGQIRQESRTQHVARTDETQHASSDYEERAEMVEWFKERRRRPPQTMLRVRAHSKEVEYACHLQGAVGTGMPHTNTPGCRRRLFRSPLHPHSAERKP